MLDQESLVIDQFKGLFDRGELKDINVTQIPVGFFKTLRNFYHQGESLISRPGNQALGKFSTDKLLRFWPYRKSNATDQFLAMYIVAGGATQNIKDSGGGTALQAITLGNDYQIFVLKDKAVGGEIALNSALQQPLGTGNTKIYLLAGAAFRDAAGLSPSAAGPMVAATSGSAGVVEAGVHLIAVSYETTTGFITPPGVFVATIYTPTQYTAPGAFKIALSVIPLGPAGTVARHILASKVVRPPFNGDVLVPELFFVPSGKINDNTTTTLTIDFYDTSLVVSADYLLDELEVIPAGACYCTYKNRLVIVGFSTGDPSAKGAPVAAAYVARVSNVGQYESFSSIEGFIQVFPNDGDALQACWEQNGNLYLAKGNRTYVARDNGGPPNTWPVELVDASIGCGPWGVTKVDNSQNSLIEGGAIIGSRRGVYFFTGQYPTTPLTYNIEALYRRTVGDLGIYSDFFYSKFYYDTYRRLLYWLPKTIVVNDIGSPLMLVGACDNGLNPEAIRWSQFDAFVTGDNASTRFIRDIYTATLAPSVDYLNTLLFMIFDDGTVANTTTKNTDIYAIRTTVSLDAQSALSGGRINWELVTFPAKVDELDKLQVVGARALMKHDNTHDPIDFLFQGFDYTYNEFLPADAQPIFFGDNAFPPLRDMVLLPQLYDCGLNFRSKLAGISLVRGIRGGNILESAFGSITNTVFIHKLMFFGNRAGMDKARGSIR